ncbi:FtsQ protein [Porphyromonas crevioricanis JCM 15906]|uniref:FtsQ protein n=1 Tax=Porphyromonas crevioricanis JCM 15906 TaxID=1305617 RepID=T1DQJ1_9PORP|nr:hypothetical protein [Porphyromonas crevioricanis]GAD04785.1 FtsQ protein [Porphyromonas crevioricanis JCM 15906]SJZ98158.1 hypothetical protein SAMN02745203_01473 [Porphyromonas crevioricanis]
MMEKILKRIFALALLIYIGWAVVYFSSKDNLYRSGRDVCRDLKIKLIDEEGDVRMTEQDVLRELKRLKCYPVGQAVDSISLPEIESRLKGTGLFKEAQAYLSPSFRLHLKLVCNEPYFFVQLSDNRSFHVTKERQIVPVSIDYSLPLLVVSGQVDSLAAVTGLFDLVNEIEQNQTWKNLFSQVYVRPDGDVCLLSRIADMEIILGKTPNWRDKLDKLEVFINQVIPRTGWDAYSTINLKFAGQIVAKQRPAESHVQTSATPSV